MNLENLCHVKDLMALVVGIEAALRKTTGLNLNQAFALCCLSKGPLNAGELAEELRIPAPSLSRIIKTLYRKSYIQYSLNENDSRQKVLSLTESGRRMALTLESCEQRIFPVGIERREYLKKA